MEYSRWAPLYRRIGEELGLPFAREEQAFAQLRALLPAVARQQPLERIAPRLAGREVVVVGLAPDAGPPPLWRRPAGAERLAVVAADGATTACLTAGLVPDLVVTDLDGPIPAELSANQRGSLVVVHAHGDNADAVAEWVPQFPGELAGSWAGPPRDGIIDVGGFTDGDRAAFLADHVGAARILLWGFDFERVVEADARSAERKRRKLVWAGRALQELAAEGRTPLLTWERDGTLAPYPAGIKGASTR
ncbi:MAG TPA: 6-hydroxymethylpterin diphosphokinase MptE-like protein [Thermoplasmata archaeon]|nr:6-hydroxymethylpterin diphosphokinase MptE-like protein [Thermoplasmata archaeon]